MATWNLALRFVMELASLAAMVAWGRVTGIDMTPRCWRRPDSGPVKWATIMSSSGRASSKTSPCPTTAPMCSSATGC